MSTEAQVVSLSGRATNTLPRAVWIGGGLLGLVTAALAGALIMKSIEAPPAASLTPATAAQASTAQPVPALGSGPTKPSPPSKPVPPAVNPLPSTSHAQSPPLNGTQQAAVCASCGVVESVSTVQQKGRGTGLGAVAGGVLGGVVGHQVGGGKGKTAMTVLGAIGGGLAGNEVEKRARSETLYSVKVRMEDGSTRVFQRAQPLAVGAHVVAEGSELRISRDGTAHDAPRTLRTSAPAAGST